MTIDQKLQTIQNCMAWADEEEEGRRNVSVDYKTGKTFQVWCYDYNLMMGMFITSPSDGIDLEAKKEQEERAMYERLAKRFAE